MANSYFKFKQFTIHQHKCAMKVTTDSCFFGAWAATEMQNEKLKIENVLDIGTGTGLLSLMMAQKNEVEIDAVEIDKDAAQQAKENIESSAWKNRIHILNEDIRFFQPAKKYDCIISNPPFYENELASETQKKNLAHHSEQLTIEEVLKFIKVHLKKGGFFFLMYPFKRKNEMEQLLSKNELYALNSIHLAQSVKHSSFRVIVKGSNHQRDTATMETISIWNEQQQYTHAFVDLLKEYYLYL
jgi:tRNA1Val (adenine37-N6)-methyltransferase